MADPSAGLFCTKVDILGWVLFGGDLAVSPDLWGILWPYDASEVGFCWVVQRELDSYEVSRENRKDGYHRRSFIFSLASSSQYYAVLILAVNKPFLSSVVRTRDGMVSWSDPGTRGLLSVMGLRGC